MSPSSLQHIWAGRASHACYTATLVLALILLPSPAGATATGLNDIVTADTPADGEVVVQAFSNFGKDRRPDHFAGVKSGLLLHEGSDLRLEVGIDGRLGPGRAGPTVFQTKLAIKPYSRLPAFAVGALNISVSENDRDRAGKAYKYAVLTQTFDWMRLTAGYGIQSSDNGAFFGLDKWLHVGPTDLQVRGDVSELDDEDTWRGSLGFLWVFCRYFALESWGSQHFDGGDIVWTMKLNFIANFKTGPLPVE